MIRFFFPLLCIICVNHNSIAAAATPNIESVETGIDSAPVSSKIKSPANKNNTVKKRIQNFAPVFVPLSKDVTDQDINLPKEESHQPDNLIETVLSGDLQGTQELLQTDGSLLHQRDSLDRTSLMLAAQKGYLEIVDALLTAGADPNAKDQRILTALSYASMKGHEKVMQSLISAHANINTVDASGKSPLIWAVISGNTAAVSLLVKTGADVNKPDLKGITPIIYSLGQDNPDNTRLLVDAGADLDVVLKKSKINVLMLAARQGNVEIIKVLINKGMDVNYKDVSGATPTLTAITNNQKAAAELLIKSGARIEDKDTIGRSAIFYSANRNIDSAIAKMLIANGATINEKENNGFTPLSLAAANGNTGVIKVLVDAGLPAGGTGTKGEFTPLMSAAANKQAAAVELLLTYKPDINASHKSGKTALMWAAKNNCLKCAELLLANGANLELVDEQNMSALDYAKQNRKAKKIVKLLETQQSVK